MRNIYGICEFGRAGNGGGAPLRLGTGGGPPRRIGNGGGAVVGAADDGIDALATVTSKSYTDGMVSCRGGGGGGGSLGSGMFCKSRVIKPIIDIMNNIYDLNIHKSDQNLSIDYRHIDSLQGARTNLR